MLTLHRPGQVIKRPGKGFEMEIKTVRLPRGFKVLAKDSQYGVIPVTYANYKQANKKIEELKAAGYDVNILGYGKPAKYIHFIEN